MTVDKPPSRSTLLRLLTEACELEHGLACSYLFAAMSLRQEPAGHQLPPDRMLIVRQWASQLYFVASQEMLHLAQAWNLLVALGGTPYYLRPNFPQDTKYYPLHMRLALEPFGEAALERFIGYEKPANLLPEHKFVEAIVKPRAGSDGQAFRTIGELYGSIEQGIASLANPIIGDPADQVGRDFIDFPDIVRVVDRETSGQAIALVTHQGEGNQSDRADCHFGIFLKLYRDLKDERKRNRDFSPAYPTLINPTTDRSEAYGAPDANMIGHPGTLEAAKLFDGLYSLMLRMLGYTFTPSGDQHLRRAFGQSAIVMMTTVLKPLGEALMQMRAAKTPAGATAGPTFGLTRHVTLPVEAQTARILVSESLNELTDKAAQLAATPLAPVAFQRLEATLRRLSELTNASASRAARSLLPTSSQ